MPEDIPLYSKEALLDRIRLSLAGRAAEELFIGKITTGAADDLNKVTQLAHQMVSVQGMNEAVGLLSYPPKNDGNPEFCKPHSEATGQLIDDEKRRLVEEEYQFTKDLLKTHEVKLLALAERLKEKEVLVTEDLVEVLGERPFGLKDQYKKFVDVRRTLNEERVKAAAEKEAQAAAQKEEGGAEEPPEPAAGEQQPQAAVA
jgi:AFG3 family protein